MTHIIQHAAQLAAYAHRKQRRKYNGEPYIHHPARVAGCFSAQAILKNPNIYYNDSNIAAAWLHDVVEDTEFSIDDLAKRFGDNVLMIVEELTDPQYEEGAKPPRKERHAHNLNRMYNASTPSKMIKLCDRWDNVCSMHQAPRGFKRLYASETLDLMETIGNILPELAQTVETHVKGWLSL